MSEPSATVWAGDCLIEMPKLLEASVDSIVTDPPYGLGFMGKDWDHGVPGPHFWIEALRVAKPGAFILAFGGTRTFHRLACAIEDAGWEMRDTIMWVYGSGFPKSHNLDGDRKGWGTALKPAWEPIIVARKPLAGTVANNVLVYGTGAMNIDACRVGVREREKFTDAKRVSAFGGNAQDYQNPRTYPRSEAPLPPGRWPANLIHDGSEEVLAGLPDAKAGGSILPGGDYARMGFGFANGESTDRSYESRGDSGSAARFFYCAKASRADRNEGLEAVPERDIAEGPGRKNGLNVKVRMENGLPTGPASDSSRAKNNHPTVKPVALMRYLCRLVTPPGGVVLDPFTGSGSTGKAALLEGFRFLGIEREDEYCEIAERRIEHAQMTSPLFSAPGGQHGK